MILCTRSLPVTPRQESCYVSRPQNGVEFVAGVQQLRKIELMWRLFNAWPPSTPRLEKTKAAAFRMESRRYTGTSVPPRWAFATTADYYDAIMPLMLARHRFILYVRPARFLCGVHKALQSLLPSHLS